MNMPHQKIPPQKDIEYLQILIIKYAMNIIETGYITWERFNKASTTYKDILTMMTSHNYIVTCDEARKQHIEQEHIELKWSCCIYNFLIQLIYYDTPPEKDFLPSGFQYNNQYNLNITEIASNSITNARSTEFILNEVLLKMIDGKNCKKIALDIKILNDFYFTYMISKVHNEYCDLKKEYCSIITETLLFIPQTIKDEIVSYSD